MYINEAEYKRLSELAENNKVTLVAVSKTKPVAAIEELYNLGHRDFGENYVQELVEKQKELPKDIRWHFIGHLQTNKVKSIIPFVHLIHGVDSFKLLKEINKQAEKERIVCNVLLQVHIAQEESKFGLDEKELSEIIVALNEQNLSNIQVKGLMGMASFTDSNEQVKKEFRFLKSLFDNLKNKNIKNIQAEILSMGMSGDYALAIQEGSNLIRIGSLIFGERKKA